MDAWSSAACCWTGPGVPFWPSRSSGRRPRTAATRSGFFRLARACLPDRRADCWDGLDPAASRTVDLVAQVLSRLDAPSLRPENPYVGLRPFEAADADRYFGREHVVADLVAPGAVRARGAARRGFWQRQVEHRARRARSAPSAARPAMDSDGDGARSHDRCSTWPTRCSGFAPPTLVAPRRTDPGDGVDARAGGRGSSGVGTACCWSSTSSRSCSPSSEPGEREQFLAVLAQCAQWARRRAPRRRHRAGRLLRPSARPSRLRRGSPPVQLFPSRR
jgi:hypothetical protein